MSSSYIWDLRQRSARHQYGFARYMLLKPILIDARTGTLDPNWRRGLSTAMSVARRRRALKTAITLLYIVFRQ